MNTNNYFKDLYLSTCDSKKIIKSISKLFSTFKKLVGFIFLAIFLLISNGIFSFELPLMAKSNVLLESRLFSLFSQEVLLYILLSHVIVKFTLKLCFLFISVKAIIFFAWFWVGSLINKENDVKEDRFAVMNFDGVVCYKSKVQFLN